MKTTDRPGIARSAPEQVGAWGTVVPLSPGQTGQVWDHARTLVKHRWWGLVGFVTLFAPVAIVTFATTPVYRATTRLLITQEQPPVVGLSQGTGGAAEPVPTLDARTQREVVQSRGLVRETVEAIRLWDTPEFFAGPTSATTDSERAQQLVDAFLGRLSVEVIPESQLIAISFEATDPALAAQAANELATRYVERDRESRFKAATDGATWLARRLAEQREQVSASETASQRYRESRDALSLEDRQNIVVQKLGDINAAVTKAKTDRIVKETQYRQLESIRDNPTALETNSLIAANAFIQGLKAQASDLLRQEAQLADRYGPRHPEMIQVRTALEAVQAKLRAEVAKVVEGVRSEYAASLSQEQSLTRALDAQKAEALSLDRKGVEYAALQREAASARQVFDALLQQTKEAAMASDLQRSSVRVVDAAEPPAAPVRPRKGQGLAAAVVLGLLGGLGAAFGREYLRTRVASPQDVERLLGLPVLALIPTSNQSDLNLVGDLPPAPAEAFRRLRTSVLLSGEGNGSGQVLVVTSTAPREGKSLIAAHLAAALSAADQRVALVDADLRRPRLHALFDRQREPGLTDVLGGSRSKAEVLRPVRLQGLSLIPSGAATPNAAELLSLHAFKDLIESLRCDFDWIVIDSPPVMAVTDAAVLAHDATGVLFVTSAEQTDLGAAEAALAELTFVGARLIGAVLNRVPLSREAYYYARYYKSDYAPYFAPQASEPRLAGGEKKRPRPATGQPAASGPAPAGESARGSP